MLSNCLLTCASKDHCYWRSLKETAACSSCLILVLCTWQGRWRRVWENSMRFLQRRSAAEQQVPLEELQAKLRDLHASIQASISEEVGGRTQTLAASSAPREGGRRGFKSTRTVWFPALWGVTSGTGRQAVQRLLSKSAQLPLLGSLPCP